MSDFVSKSEVKNILRITDGYVENESVTMSSMSPKRLSKQYVTNILFVSSDTLNSTKTTYYTTSDYKTTTNKGGYTLINKLTTSSTIGDTQTIYVTYQYNQYDTQIDDLIPQVKNDLVEYLHNTFIDKQTQYVGSHFQIVHTSTANQIRDTEQKFLIEGFQTGMDIYLDGSERNKGIYTVSSASSEYLKISTNSTLFEENSTDEYGGKIISISRMRYPTGLKRTVAKIIWASMDRSKSDNIKSKSIGPLSLTYNSLNDGGYDEAIYNELKKYKYTKMS